MEIKDINLKEYEILEQKDKEIIVLKKKKSKYPKWEDLNRISGCYITDNCIIRPASNIKPNEENKNVFLTEKHAKSALAMAQISQLMPYYGGEIIDGEWKDGGLRKFVIIREGDHISSSWCTKVYRLPAFHTEEQRDEFLKNNEQLVKDYLMIE